MTRCSAARRAADRLAGSDALGDLVVRDPRDVASATPTAWAPTRRTAVSAMGYTAGRVDG